MVFRYIFIITVVCYLNLFGLTSKEQQKTVEELSLGVSSYLYNVEYENIPLALKSLIDNNAHIKAIEIKEDFENKIVYSYFYKNEKRFFNDPIPKYIKNNYIHRTIKSKFNNMVVGEVTVYFTQIGDLKLSEEEKSYLKENIFTVYTNKWEPFSIFNKKTKLYEGLSHEFWGNIVENTGVNYKIEYVEQFSEMLKRVKDDKKGILLSISHTKQREEFASFSKPYVSYPVAIATNTKESFLLDLSELTGKTVAVGKNFSAHKLLKKHYPEIQFVLVGNTFEAITLLSQNKVFAAADILPVLKSHLEKSNYTNIKISGTSEFKFDVRFMVNKEQQELIPILNKAIDAISKSDRKQINEKWNSKQVVLEKVNYTLLYYFIIISVLVVLFLLYRQLMLKNINSELNRKVEDRTRDLQKLNDTLETKVKEQVEQLRKNDLVIIEQSKMASMGEMIGNIAHQWRQPLSVISTSASGAKIQKELGALDDQTFEKHMDRIVNQAEYLSETIDDFKNFVKKEKDEVEFSTQEIVDRFLHLVEGTIKTYDITVDLKVDSDTTLYGYPNELLQCVLNIFNNSKDVFKQTDNPNYFFIEVVQKKSYVYIILKDNAGGIPEDVLPHIFEPYFTTKHQSQGTGLGLSMTYNLIVNSMNGEIKVDNETYTYQQKKFIGAKTTIKLPVVT